MLPGRMYRTGVFPVESRIRSSKKDVAIFLGPLIPIIWINTGVEFDAAHNQPKYSVNDRRYFWNGSQMKTVMAKTNQLLKQQKHPLFRSKSKTCKVLHYAWLQQFLYSNCIKTLANPSNQYTRLLICLCLSAAYILCCVVRLDWCSRCTYAH